MIKYNDKSNNSRGCDVVLEDLILIEYDIWGFRIFGKIIIFFDFQFYFCGIAINDNNIIKNNNNNNLQIVLRIKRNIYKNILKL